MGTHIWFAKRWALMGEAALGMRYTSWEGSDVRNGTSWAESAPGTFTEVNTNEVLNGNETCGFGKLNTNLKIGISVSI